MIDVDSARKRRIAVTTAIFFGSVALVGLSALLEGTAGVVLTVVAGAVGAGAGVYFSRLVRSWIPAWWSLYIVLVVAGAAIREVQKPVRLSTMWVIAGATIGAAVIGMGCVVRAVRRSRELERLISIESITIAFFTTMIASLTYGLLEVWVKAPRPSAWVPWTVGMFTWAIASTVFQRRYS